MRVVVVAMVSFVSFAVGSETGRHVSPDAPGSAGFYIAQLRNPNKIAFHQIVSDYDNYIRLHPSNLVVRIEQCTFIETAVDEELVPYDEESLVEERAVEIRSLFAADPRAAAYLSTRMKSDSALSFLEGFTKQHKDTLRCAEAWQLWARFAQLYADEDNPYSSIHYAVEAMRCNDTLDLTVLVAEQSLIVGDAKTALAYVSKFEDKDAVPWALRRKAELLIQLSQFDRAVALFLRILKEDESSEASFDIGQALRGSGRYAEARAAFIKAGMTSYNAQRSARAVFEIDLQTASADSAVASYNAMRDLGFNTDPLGKYRLALFLHHPLLPWRWQDFLNWVVLALCLLACALLPAAVVAPIHYAGLLRKTGTPSPSRWNLKHVWCACSFLILGSFLAIFFYQYDTIIEEFGGRIVKPVGRDHANLAWADMLYLAIVALGSIAMVRLSDLNALWGTRWSKTKSVFSGLGVMIVVRIVFGIILIVLVLVFHVGSYGHEYFKPLAGEIMEDLQSIRDTFGWPWLIFVTVLVAPLCEELIFRGVLLQGFKRHIPFFWANLVQAVGFSLLHKGVTTIIFAVIFGVVAGMLRQRANSLMPSIVAHVSNNLVATGVFLIFSP